MSAPARWTTTRFSETRKQILSDERLQGLAFCQAYAGAVDSWLSELLGDEEGVALVAVGGYGRGELAPGSDIDVILVYRKRRGIEEVASRIWYPIWEAGIPLDHGVKTVDEALKVAATDLKAAVGLLDARTVAGDALLGDELARKASTNWERKHERWIRALAANTRERHERFGDVAFLLEPDLKEGRGGLRDVYGLRALELALPALPELESSVLDAKSVLIEARVALQRHTGKSSDRLLLQDQADVAAALGCSDADELMRRVASAARTIGWTSDDKWHRAESHLAGPTGRVVKADHPVSEGVVLREGEVVVLAGATMSDPSLPLRVASASATTGAPIARATLERLREEASGPGDPWPPGTRESLVSLLATGAPSIPAFEALDQYGLVVRLLPEWEPVRSRLQHNPYHRYTVDRHLLETTRVASELAHGVRRPDLLLVAAWLHDLGKGYPGDHTAAGVELVGRIATRMDFPPDDVDVLVRLVRDHLLLADAATRRDIRDPATSQQVADAVGDPLTLELLAALTEADSRATGPTAWTAWKAGLMTELVERVADVLEGARPRPKPDELEPRLQALVDEAAGEILVREEDERVVVVAPDQPGLFCQLAGVLALQGLDVLAADVQSNAEGVAVDEFWVQPTHGDAPDWPRFRLNVAKVLDGRLALEARLTDRAHAYDTTLQRVIRERITPSVTVHNDASNEASVVEVRAENAVGILYRVARAFYELHLDIRHAKVQTLGHEVVDSFYVVDRHGQKLADDDQLAEIRRAVLFELSRATS